MGYSGNYTGYSVNGLDVLYWILLTGGSILFPIIVFTVCCLKKRYKTQKLVHGLLYSDQPNQNQQLKKSMKKGLNGPFNGSEDNLNKKLTKKTMPEIVISPYTFETSNKNFSPSNPMFINNDKNHVRFKEDGQQNDFPSLMPNEFENDLDNGINSSDLRGLKDAVNYFNKNAIKKPNRQPSYTTNLSNRSLTSGQSQLQSQQRYSNNPIQEYIQANDEDDPPKEIIYSISSSYAQPQISSMYAQENINNNIKNRPIDENIYSQVVAPSIKRSGSNQPVEEEEEIIEQPLYMNTPYNLNQQKTNSRNSSDKNSISNKWNDSSL